MNPSLYAAFESLVPLDCRLKLGLIDRFSNLDKKEGEIGGSREAEEVHQRCTLLAVRGRPRGRLNLAAVKSISFSPITLSGQPFSFLKFLITNFIASIVHCALICELVFSSVNCKG
jgi:hypothetical protein